MKRSYKELTCLLHMSGLTATKVVVVFFVYFVVLYYVCDYFMLETPLCALHALPS